MTNEKIMKAVEVNFNDVAEDITELLLDIGTAFAKKVYGDTLFCAGCGKDVPREAQISLLTQILEGLEGANSTPISACGECIEKRMAECAMEEKEYLGGEGSLN